jgi:hypothetical protein
MHATKNTVMTVIYDKYDGKWRQTIYLTSVQQRSSISKYKEFRNTIYKTVHRLTLKFDGDWESVASNIVVVSVRSRTEGNTRSVRLQYVHTRKDIFCQVGIF